MTKTMIQPPGVFAHQRTGNGALHAVMPPEGVLESRMPNFEQTKIRVLTSPHRGSKFAQVMLEMAMGGGMQAPRHDNLQHFFYVVEGHAVLEMEGATHALTPGAFAYAPAGTPLKLRAANGEAANVMWIQKPYESVEGVAPPKAFTGHADRVEKVNKHTQGRTWQHLMPDSDIAHDFAVNILAFEPGNYFPMVETHVMEHGLYMLGGQGMYLLEKQWYECWTRDFIWMGPYCPQFFYATGWETASYLLYKDVNRDIAFPA